MTRITVSVIALGLVAALAGCPNQDRNESIEHMNKGAHALSKHQLETAIVELKEAVRIYPKNHVAEYQLGVAYDKRKNYEDSAKHFGNAVQLLPDNVVYNMLYGVALYKDAIAKAAKEQAKKMGDNVKPESLEESDLDLRAVNFDEAQKYLQAGIKLNGDLWYHHYYLGKIYAIHEKPQLAAQEFTAAIQGDPREEAPYVALAKLYLKWDYTDQAIQVAAQGQKNIPGQADRAKAEFTLGMGYYDKRKLDDAISAFSDALKDSGGQEHNALFQRGLSYYAQGDKTKAKKDLEQYTKTAGKTEEFNKSMASKLLMDIAAKQN
jgi:tetratricopeptide (TPR) repeat protein